MTARLLLSSPVLTAVSAAAGVSATALATIALAVIHGIPVVNVATVLLLPLGAAAGFIRPRPAGSPRARAVAPPLVVVPAGGAAAPTPPFHGGGGLVGAAHNVAPVPVLRGAVSGATHNVTAAHPPRGGAAANCPRWPLRGSRRGHQAPARALPVSHLFTPGRASVPGGVR